MSIDPITALRTRVGDMLADDPAVTAIVESLNIRAGAVRPEALPAIILAPGRASILGRAAGGQIVAEVRLLLHLWLPEDGTATAQNLGAAVLAALMDSPAGDGFSIDEWDRPNLDWTREATAERVLVHGVIGLRAVVRWRA